MILPFVDAWGPVDQPTGLVMVGSHCHMFIRLGRRHRALSVNSCGKGVGPWQFAPGRRSSGYTWIHRWHPSGSRKRILHFDRLQDLVWHRGGDYDDGEPGRFKGMVKQELSHSTVDRIEFLKLSDRYFGPPTTQNSLFLPTCDHLRAPLGIRESGTVRAGDQTTTRPVPAASCLRFRPCLLCRTRG